MLRLAAARRGEYAAYQPQFWRPAPDALERQREHFTGLLQNDQALVVVAVHAAKEVRGFAVAQIVQAPPVYDPDGGSCIVDDFVVAGQQQWPEAGQLLLDAVRRWATSRGAAQIIVVTARLDEAKRALLAASGLSAASEWWVGSISS